MPCGHMNRKEKRRNEYYVLTTWMVSNSEINTSGNANVESFCIIWVLDLVRLLTFSRYLFLHLHFTNMRGFQSQHGSWIQRVQAVMMTVKFLPCLVFCLMLKFLF